MEFIAFIATVILVSLSGVLTPGPLFAATIAEGRSNRYAGFLISAGHATVEIPIIIGLFMFGASVANESIRSVVGLAGGIVLLYFAYSELKSEKDVKPIRGVLTGIAMSSLNPYFIVWWLTVGFHLTIQATGFGLLGLTTFIIAHELCDFSWLGFTSIISNRTAEMWGDRVRKILTATSTSILLVFGVYFIYDGVIGLLSL